MAYNDSIDKVVHYFSCVTNEPFIYKDKIYEVKLLHVSPGIIRGYKCPGNCGGCCQKFTLDYLPTEQHSKQVVERLVEFNNRKYRIYTDEQRDNKSDRCRYLNKEEYKSRLVCLADLEIKRKQTYNELIGVSKALGYYTREGATFNGEEIDVRYEG